MLVAGLTGGIGSGKSTFAALLAEKGAHVVDADELGRAALTPGRRAWHSVVSQFGEEILVPGSMEVDRARLADVVFGSPEALTALNAIVHPVIIKGIADELEVLRGTDEIVVIDAALVVEAGLRSAVDVLIVVHASKEARTGRLHEQRGMTMDQIAARMAAQQDPNELLSMADMSVVNDGSPDSLKAEAERVWGELTAMREAPRR